MQCLINYRIKSTIVHNKVNFQTSVELPANSDLNERSFPKGEGFDYFGTKKVNFRDFHSFQCLRTQTYAFSET